MFAHNSNKDSLGILFDTRTKAVMTTLPQSKRTFIKEKVSAVKEVLPNKSNHEITLVLQYYEFNVSDTIAAFMEDGAKSALNAWNYTGNKPAKKKNKKKSSKQSSSVTASENMVNSDVQAKDMAGTASSQGEKLEIDYIQNAENYPVINGVEGFRIPEVPDEKLGDNCRIRTDNSEKPLSTPGRGSSRAVPPISHSNEGRSRQQWLSLSEDSTKSKTKVKKNLDKSVKELLRHTLSFQRSGNLLNEELDKSQKRLQQSFKELRQILDERERQLTKELENVKRQATELLTLRQDQGAKLKVSVDKVCSMTDGELNELRIDIKHFVSEKKFDDELWRTVRFVRDHNKLVGEINAYGEVIPAPNRYTQRRQSVSSTTSTLTQPETIPVATSGAATAAGVELNDVPSKVESCSNTLSDASTTLSSSSLSPSELAILHQKLQESLRLQGFPTTTSIPVGRDSQNWSSRVFRTSASRPLRTTSSEMKTSAQLNGTTFDRSSKEGYERKENSGRVVVGYNRGSSDSFGRNYRQNMRRGNSRFPPQQADRRPYVQE